VKSVAAKSTAKSKAKVQVKSKPAAAKPAPASARAKAPVKAAPKTKAKAAAPARAPAVNKAAAPQGKRASAKPAPKPAPKAVAAAPRKPAPAAAKKTVAAKPVKPISPARPPVAPKALPTPIGLTAPAHVAVKKNPRLANNWKTKPVEQWNDAEVIAMPDGEYMNEPQMAFFRLKLVALKNGILANADQTAENLRDDTVVVPDPADRATIEEEHALELRTRDRERKLLKKIEQSIARIDAGDYGYCDETGEPIGVPRLLARPTATLSLEAQQRRELKQKMFGD
jgi:DnaK suppressor protein